MWIFEKIGPIIVDSAFYSVSIYKNASPESFIAICDMFNEYKKNIDCRTWQFVTINNRTFTIPTNESVVNLKLNNEGSIMIKILGENEVIGFRIYYSKPQDFIHFVRNMLCNHIKEKEFNNIIESFGVDEDKHDDPFIKKVK